MDSWTRKNSTRASCKFSNPLLSDLSLPKGRYLDFGFLRPSFSETNTGHLQLAVGKNEVICMGTGVCTEYLVMHTRLGKLVDYVDASSWRFGFVLSAMVAVEMAVFAVAFST